MRIDVGRATDPERYLATEHAVWFTEVPSASAELQLIGLPEDQRFAADLDGSEPGTYPGIYGVFPLTLSIPGPGAGVRQVPCAGLTWVGVHPDHRRKGVLTAMLRHHFEQVHEESGTHLSALHASEPAIYGRHGYGLASLELEVSLGSGTTLTAPHLEETARDVTTQLAAVSDPNVPKRIREVPHGLRGPRHRGRRGRLLHPAVHRAARAPARQANPGGCCSHAGAARTRASRCSAAATSGNAPGPPES